MDQSIVCREMRHGEEAEVVGLVRKIFLRSVAPLYSEEGVAEFMRYIDPTDLADRTQGDNVVHVAEVDDGIAGVIETRDYSHIALFFVTAEHQRKGIGRALLANAIQKCVSSKPGLTAITVNSSPNAVRAYRRLGFTQEGEERTVNGIRHVPMALGVTELHGSQ